MSMNGWEIFSLTLLKCFIFYPQPSTHSLCQPLRTFSSHRTSFPAKQKCLTSQGLYSHTQTCHAVTVVCCCCYVFFSLDFHRNIVTVGFCWKLLRKHQRVLGLLHLRGFLSSCFLFCVTPRMARETPEALSLSMSVWNMWLCTSGWRKSPWMSMCVGCVNRKVFKRSSVKWK